MVASRRIAVLVVGALLVAAPQAALAADVEQGRTDGERDARENVASLLWFAGGFCLAGPLTIAGAYYGGEITSLSWYPENVILGGLAGFVLSLVAVGAAYLVVPAPPAARLVGKSSEYAAAYSAAYRAHQVRSAARGWCCGSATVGVVLLAIGLIIANT